MAMNFVSEFGRRATLAALVVVTAKAALVSCGPVDGETGSSAQERTPGTSSSSWTDPAEVNAALGASRALRINAHTNYVTYYEHGFPLSKWKIATARPGKETPKGIFVIHNKDVCPPWSLNGASAGPCAPDNPLGTKALWFYDNYTYGLHGVNAANLWSVTTQNPRDRDQSSGCVRNHPENIEWLFARVNVGTPVVSGSWASDPSVVDCSGNASLCSGESEPGPGGGGTLLPTTLPQWCSINVSENGGIANVRAASSTESTVVAELNRQSRVRVERQISGQFVNGSSDWYFVTFTLSGNKEGYIHSSLLDCTR